MIAALFIEEGGVYCGLPNVDPWGIERDARKYPGPYSVVAHPPCQRWGRYAEGSPTLKNWKAGDDCGCFATALHSVRLWGGVLEHPAESKAWQFFGLLNPWPTGWTQAGKNEWVCLVDQGHYGHAARKPTWLLVVGSRPPELIWGPAPQRLITKKLEADGYEKAMRRGMIENMSKKQRQRTPLEFRDLLISLAESADGWGKAV